MLDDFTFLKELSLDFNEFTTGITVEFCDNSDWLRGINLELITLTKEVLDTSSEWVQIAAILVADTVVSMVGSVVTTGNFVLTLMLSIDGARMSSEGR